MLQNPDIPGGGPASRQHRAGGAVIPTGDSPAGQVDLKKGMSSKHNMELLDRSFVIILISVYALCIITLFECFVLKGIGTYLGHLNDNFILLNRFSC